MIIKPMATIAILGLLLSFGEAEKASYVRGFREGLYRGTAVELPRDLEETTQYRTIDHGNAMLNEENMDEYVTGYEGKTKDKRKSGAGKEEEEIKYECPKLKEGEPIVIPNSPAEAHYEEHNFDMPGDRAFWYGKENSGSCTLLQSRDDAEDGMAPELCKKIYTWPYQSEYPDSTLVLSGIFTRNATFGTGQLTIVGGTGCFKGVSGIADQTLVGFTYTDTLYLEEC